MEPAPGLCKSCGVFQDLKQPYQGQDNIGGVVESWPWFHIMDEAMQGRLYNSNLVLSPETAGNAAHRCGSHQNQNQENTDILEFLIKTEMEDTVSAETAGDDGPVHAEAPPAEGVPMGWRRMSECSYKSRQTHVRHLGANAVLYFRNGCFQSVEPELKYSVQNR